MHELSRAAQLFRGMPTIRIILLLLIQTVQCLASDDSPFQLTNKATGFCLVKTSNTCNDIRWTTGDRLLVQQRNKCLGVQGKSVGSEISLYDCDENSDLQMWECKNHTMLALKGQVLYIQLTADNTAVLSKTTGPNNHLTISGTSSGACTRTHRALHAIGGNAAGKLCMFPFLYKHSWYSDCTTFDATDNYLWCAVETKFQSERWGYCPTTSKKDWNRHPTTGAYYQLNTDSALTWPEAEASCRQQGASLLSITDPHEQAYVTALLGRGEHDFWIGLSLIAEHGWKWSNGRPYRYMKWDSGHPLHSPGHYCVNIDATVQYSWQSSPCSKRLGYICCSKQVEETQAFEIGFCSSPWIPYNGHCLHLDPSQKSWSDAQTDCRNGGGDLVSIHNVEDQSFVITQLGYASSEELWIGLNDRKTEGLFDWVDHSAVSFTSWEFGNPSVSSEIKDCVLISGEKGNWYDRVCEEKHGYICMKKSSPKPTGDEVERDVGCKSGWKRYGSYCYFIGTKTKTFDEAKDNCKSSDSYLADVSSGVDNAFLISLVGLRPEKYFWLGLSNQKNIDTFVWTKSNSVSFTHWNAEMPGQQQGCVAMRTGTFAGLWDVLPCTNKEKYICKHLAEGAGLTPAPPTLNPPKCADSWTKLGSRNYCFKLFLDGERNWYEARKYCRTIGGDLLSIHSSDERGLLPYRYSKVWIGLSAPDPDTGYAWSDGSPLQFQHWEGDEPDNKNNSESCVEVKMNSQSWVGSWSDVNCEKLRGWLCQILAGSTPKPHPNPAAPDYNTTSDGWLEWKGNQYYLVSMLMAMEEARQHCKQMHSDLVSINSDAENNFLWKHTLKHFAFYWIGLNVDLDGTFTWMDGAPGVFQSWDANQPHFKNYDEHCGVMGASTGLWHSYNCGFEYQSICKRSGTPPANATVVPTVLPRGGCPQNWKTFDSKCYNIINSQSLTWEGARTQCKSMGGNLASILSRRVQVFLTAEMTKAPTTSLWIGFHDQQSSMFYWTDGQKVQYSNWGLQRFRRSITMYDEMQHYSYEDYEVVDIFNLKNCVAMTTDPNIGIGKWTKCHCNNENGYVCHRNLDPALPDPPEPTVSTEYVGIFNDSIKVVTQPMTWQAALKHCRDDGAELASLRNEWSVVYIEMMAMKLNTNLWIGLNKNQTGGYFRYVDGWHMTFSNWDGGEPSQEKNCVQIDVEGKWKTADCNQSMNSICMKSTDVPPTEPSKSAGICPDDQDLPLILGRPRSTWLPFRGYCYRFHAERMGWPDAAVGCVRHGGALVSIEDPFEQQFIQNNVKTFQDSDTSFWIGLHKTHNGLWQWLDKTVMDYSNWDLHQPADGDYAELSVSNGMWKTDSWNYYRAYICKTPKVLLQEPPPTEKAATVDPGTRGHIALASVVVIAAIVLGTILFLIFSKKAKQPVTKKLTVFDNPLFFNNEKTDPVDTNKLEANPDVENPGPIITV